MSEQNKSQVAELIPFILDLDQEKNVAKDAGRYQLMAFILLSIVYGHHLTTVNAPLL